MFERRNLDRIFPDDKSIFIYFKRYFPEISTNIGGIFPLFPLFPGAKICDDGDSETLLQGNRQKHEAH
jgi:hypothetical protein